MISVMLVDDHVIVRQGLDARRTGAARQDDRTDREVDVLRCVGEGMAIEPIVRKPGSSERTVKAHRTSIFQRRGVSDRMEGAPGPAAPAASMKRWALALVLFVGACASEPTPASPVITDGVVATTAAPAPVTSVPASTASAATATTVATASTAPDTVLPEGFDRVQATVTKADGTVCELCLWLAATGEQRAQGLMFVTDLGDADGMAFRYDSPQTGAFWMKNTLLPLSIAFYAADGRYLGAFDMEPCTADPCPTYPTLPEFTVAIETTKGNLGALGIESGSTLQLTDLPCA